MVFININEVSLPPLNQLTPAILLLQLLYATHLPFHRYTSPIVAYKKVCVQIKAIILLINIQVENKLKNNWPHPHRTVGVIAKYITSKCVYTLLKVLRSRFFRFFSFSFRARVS